MIESGVKLTSFNWLDYVIIGVLICSTLVSFLRGFLKEAISLGIWVVGLLLAIKFSGELQMYFTAWLHSPLWRYSLIFMGIFLAVFIFGLMLNALISAVIKKVGLTKIDRFLGIFFGMARGVLVVGITLMFMQVEGWGKKPLSQSMLAERFSPLISRLKAFLPQEISELSLWLSTQKNQISTKVQ